MCRILQNYMFLILFAAAGLSIFPAPARGAAPPSGAPGTVTVVEVVTGLDHPWALAFLPDGQGILLTERPGRLRLWSAGGGLSDPIEGVPEVFAHSQGGLLDVALSPGFDQDRRVYLSYAEGGDGGKAGTAAGYGRLSQDNRRLEDFTVVLRQMPKLSTGQHFGSRLVFDRHGHLYITLGENNRRATSQDLSGLQGKVVRIDPDGRIPPDNPFVGQEGVRPEIWSYGHRNPQGAALNPWSGEVWTSEHGPRGGDEVNIAKAGKNYGWPLATHGINYSGQPIPEARGAQAAGTEQPLYYWKVSPAISGMAFYDSDRFPAWRHSLFIGALVERQLIRLQLNGDVVAHEERLLESRDERIRDVRLGPDGFIYVLTDSSRGKLLRVGRSQ